MQFSKYLYVSEKVENLAEMKAMITDNIGIIGTNILLVNSESENLMSIVKSTEIIKCTSFYKDHIVVGIAKGRKDALKLLQHMVQEYLKYNKNLDGFKNYLIFG